MVSVRVLVSTVLLVSISFSAHAAGGIIDGVLSNESGAMIPNADLGLQNGRGTLVQKATSEKDGHFAFADVPAGSYEVMARQNDVVLGTMTVTINDGEHLTQEFKLGAKTMSIVVAARKLQEARNNLSPQTGTNAYVIDSKAVDALPEGDNTDLSKVLLQAPGVAQDSAASGDLHLRGEHANLQYRLNGILLPEGVTGFGDSLDSRMVDSMTLLDGVLPAQYGFRTAGVVDIQTKTGFANEGSAEMYGGSHGTIEPSVSYAGTYGSVEYFLNANHLSSDLGIENPTRSQDAIHDHTEQNKQFGYMSYLINSSQRVQLIAGDSISYFQIPNSPGQTGNFCDGATCNVNSSQLNERQFESNQYATAAWQGQKDALDIQVAPYMLNAEVHYRPDSVGDLIFNGDASDVLRTDLAYGVQGDGSYKVNLSHMLRSGFVAQQEHAVSDNNSQVFAGGVDAAGNAFQTSTTPINITDENQKDGQFYGLYVQDEWKLTSNLTMNYGARFDDVEAYVSENQLSPRLGFVYKPFADTTLHAGYARYFTPPPLELVGPTSLAKFVGTTQQPTTTLDSSVKSERSHNFDAGLTQQLTDRIKLGLDAYYKLVHDLLDEGQFGQALVLTPFNYQHGYIYGSEFTADYTGEKFKAYANLAFSRAMGENIVSSQFNFTDPAELAYIQSHYVHLDHDQTWTASAGGTYTIFDGTNLGLDGIYGSGLRRGFANEDHLPGYVTFNASVTQDLQLFPNDKTQFRFTIVNLLNSAYELRDGSGIGVGAPQYGQRIGFFAGLTQGF